MKVSQEREYTKDKNERDLVKDNFKKVIDLDRYPRYCQTHTVSL